MVAQFHITLTQSQLPFPITLKSQSSFFLFYNHIKYIYTCIYICMFLIRAFVIEFVKGTVLALKFFETKNKLEKTGICFKLQNSVKIF